MSTLKNRYCFYGKEIDFMLLLIGKPQKDDDKDDS